MNLRTEEQKKKKKLHDLIYLMKKFDMNIFNVKYNRAEFCKLTRLIYDGELPKECYLCGSIEELQIHHKKYSYPIKKIDLVRLCRKCHNEVHTWLYPDTV